MVAHTGRHAGVDCLRLVAFCAVVCIHAYGLFPDDVRARDVVRDLSRFAVPIFFILAGYYSAPASTMSKLTRRMVWPWVFWLLFYNLRPGYFSGDLAVLPLQLAATIWQGGAGYHLWYIPALLVGGAIVSKSLDRLGWPLTGVLVSVLYLIGMALGVYSQQIVGSPPIYALTRSGLFFSPLYFFLGIALRRFRVSMFAPAAAWIALAVFGLLLHQAEKYWLRGETIFENEFSFGTAPWAVGLTLAFLRYDRPSSPILAELSQASFGAYLVHLFVLGRLAAAVPDLSPYLHIALCIVISIGLTVVYRRLVSRYWPPLSARFSSFTK